MIESLSHHNPIPEYLQVIIPITSNNQYISLTRGHFSHNHPQRDFHDNFPRTLSTSNHVSKSFLSSNLVSIFLNLSQASLYTMPGPSSPQSLCLRGGRRLGALLWHCFHPRCWRCPRQPWREVAAAKGSAELRVEETFQFQDLNKKWMFGIAPDAL